MGSSYQPITAGNYSEICINNDTIPIYKHESEELYMYHFYHSGKSFWLVSNTVGGDFKIMGMLGSTNCPNFQTWFVRTGPNSSTDVISDNIVITEINTLSI